MVGLEEVSIMKIEVNVTLDNNAEGGHGKVDVRRIVHATPSCLLQI